MFARTVILVLVFDEKSLVGSRFSTVFVFEVVLYISYIVLSRNGRRPARPHFSRCGYCYDAAQSEVEDRGRSCSVQGYPLDVLFIVLSCARGSVRQMI